MTTARRHPVRTKEVCTDEVDGRTCTCPTGFSGDDCQTIVTDCDDDPCKNGATCTDVAGSYDLRLYQRFLRSEL